MHVTQQSIHDVFHVKHQLGCLTHTHTHLTHPPPPIRTEKGERGEVGGVVVPLVELCQAGSLALGADGIPDHVAHAEQCERGVSGFLDCARPPGHFFLSSARER
jgi:hypothetical protein